MSHLCEAKQAFFFHYDPESHRICWRLEIRYYKFPSKPVRAPPAPHFPLGPGEGQQAVSKQGGGGGHKGRWLGLKRAAPVMVLEMQL